MRADWRPLANTVHPSPQLNRQIDRLSQFCTAHDRVSSDMPGHVLSPNNCPLDKRTMLWLPSAPGFWHDTWTDWFHVGNLGSICTCFFGPTRVHNPNGISTGSAVFAQFTSECRREYRGLPFPTKLPFPMGICPPCNMWFLGSTRLSIPNGISIGSAVFAQLTTCHSAIVHDCSANLSLVWLLKSRVRCYRRSLHSTVLQHACRARCVYQNIS